MSLRESVINEVLKDSAAMKAVVNKGIRQRSVDTQRVTNLPINPGDGDQVFLVKNGVLVLARHTGKAWEYVGAHPTGTIGWTGGTIPTGSVAADGAAISRTDYADLFAVYGTTHGVGDGSTTFNVPNLVNKFVVGAGGTYALGATGGTAASNMPAHTHTGPSHAHSITGESDHAHGTGVGGQSFALHDSVSAAQSGAGTGAISAIAGNTGNAGSHSHGGATGSAGTGATGSAGSGGASDNLPPYVALNPFIWT